MDLSGILALASETAFGYSMFHISCGNLHESADETKFDDNAFLFKGEMKLSDVMNKWYYLVTRYGKRRLTYERDRFPALSALVRTISDQFPDEKYLAGLWKSDLHRGLLWTNSSCNTPSNHLRFGYNEYVAPSWSWARRSSDAHWLTGTFSPEFELTDTKIVTDKHNPYGRVSSGNLKLHAKVFKFPLGEGKGSVVDGGRQYSRFKYRLLSEGDEYIASLCLD